MAVKGYMRALGVMTRFPILVVAVVTLVDHSHMHLSKFILLYR